MKTWTILGLDGSTVGDIEAAGISLREDGIATFHDEAGGLVGLVRDWSLVRAEPQEQDAGMGPKDLSDAIARVSGVAAISRGPMPTKPQQASDGPTYTPDASFDETDELVAAAEVHAVTFTGDRGASIMITQTSEPDAPGVSTDPIPEPEPALALDDVDANPAGSPEAGSTGDDDPPAAKGPTVVYEGNETRAPDTTRTELSRLYTSLRATPILRAFVAKQETEGLPVKVGDLTIEQREAAIAWLKNPPAEVLESGDDA